MQMYEKITIKKYFCVFFQNFFEWIAINSINSFLKQIVFNDSQFIIHFFSYTIFFTVLRVLRSYGLTCLTVFYSKCLAFISKYLLMTSTDSFSGVVSSE